MKNQITSAAMKTEYISILETSHPVESAAVYYPNDHTIGRHTADGTIRIEAVIRWGVEHGQTQRLTLMTAHTGPQKHLTASDCDAFASRALPQLLTLWARRYPSVPVAGHNTSPAPVTLPVTVIR